MAIDRGDRSGRSGREKGCFVRVKSTETQTLEAHATTSQGGTNKMEQRRLSSYFNTGDGGDGGQDQKRAKTSAVEEPTEEPIEELTEEDSLAWLYRKLKLAEEEKMGGFKGSGYGTQSGPLWVEGDLKHDLVARMDGYEIGDEVERKVLADLADMVEEKYEYKHTGPMNHKDEPDGKFTSKASEGKSETIGVEVRASRGRWVNRGGSRGVGHAGGDAVLYTLSGTKEEFQSGKLLVPKQPPSN